MKKSFLLLLFIFFIFHVTIAQSNDWYKIKDKDAAYLIEFPTEPVKGESDVPTDKGTVKMNTYTLQKDNDKNLVYMTSFTKYPDSFFPNKLESEDEQNRVLKNCVDGAVNNTNGKLIYEDKIVFNGYRGRIVKIELSDGYMIKMKVVIVGIKLYLAQVIYTKENDDNLNSKYFFDSLELINVRQ